MAKHKDSRVKLPDDLLGKATALLNTPPSKKKAKTPGNWKAVEKR